MRNLARLATARSDTLRAARYLGTADTLAGTMKAEAAETVQPELQSTLAEAAGARAYAEGQAMTLKHAMTVKQAVAYALASADVPPPASQTRDS